MSLSEEYQRQFELRSWQTMLELLPALAGTLVLDLGCNIGDQAAELAARGARVIGIDANKELLSVARTRGIPRAEFRSGDLTEPLDVSGFADGIWSSFVPAYFPDLTLRLKQWSQHSKPGGWIALTEIDDLFGQEPVQPATQALLAAYAADALVSNRYDFHMGHKLRTHLESAGFTISHDRTVEDKEFSRLGPLDANALASWASRLDRMRALQRFCGSEFDRVRSDFLAALASPIHRSKTTVHFCLATKSTPSEQSND
jgi:SAM-dependent methyltransferase